MTIIEIEAQAPSIISADQINRWKVKRTSWAARKGFVQFGRQVTAGWSRGDSQRETNLQSWSPDSWVTPGLPAHHFSGSIDTYVILPFLPFPCFPCHFYFPIFSFISLYFPFPFSFSFPFLSFILLYFFPYLFLSFPFLYFTLLSCFFQLLPNVSFLFLSFIPFLSFHFL